nr:MAG TPA: hypothetical protein [Caudoviricetes sp.]
MLASGKVKIRCHALHKIRQILMLCSSKMRQN